MTGRTLTAEHESTISGSQNRARVALVLLVAVVALFVAGHITALSMGSGAAGLWMPLDRGYDALSAAWIFVCGFALGRWLVRRLGCGSDLDAAAVGLGTLGTLIFGVGLAGLYRPIFLVGLLALLTLLFHRDVRDIVLASTRRVRWIGIQRQSLRSAIGLEAVGLVVVGLLIMLAALAVIRALTPSVEADAVTYHLGLPKLYLERGRFLSLPYRGGDGYPFTVEMLYLIGLAMGSEAAPRLIHLAFTAITAIALRRFASVREGHLAGKLAVLVFLTLPATLPVGSWAYVDLASTCFQVLAVQALLTWREAKDRRWLILAGLLTGFALGTKLLALQLFVIALLVVGWTLRRERRPIVPSLALFGLVALVVASPWYLKNWAWAGDPLYPMASQLRRVVAQGWGTSISTAAGISTTPGVGQSPVDYVLLPINVFLHSEAFTNGHAPTVFGPLLGLAPLALLLRVTQTTRWMLFVAAVLFALWGRGYQEARYFLPGAALLAGVAGVVLARLFERYRQDRLLLTAVHVAVLATVLLVFVDQAEATLTRRDLAAGNRTWASPIAYLVGTESRDQYLATRYYDYRALRYLNAETPPTARVLFLGTWAGGYYADRALIQGSLIDLRWLIPTPQGYTYPIQHGTEPIQPGYAPTMPAALRALRREGISHLFVGKVVVGRDGQTSAVFTRFFGDLRREVDAGSLLVVYSDAYASILEIQP